MLMIDGKIKQFEVGKVEDKDGNWDDDFSYCYSFCCWFNRIDCCCL